MESQQGDETSCNEVLKLRYGWNKVIRHYQGNTHSYEDLSVINYILYVAK